MESTRKITTILALAVALCFVLASVAQATDTWGGRDWAKKNLKNRKEAVNIPIWQITQDGTRTSVVWVDHTPNPRFAIYDVSGNNAGGEPYFQEDLVLDKETGLVWTRNAAFLGTGAWDDATACARQFVTRGYRMGWRLPTVEELQSLVDPRESNPALPLGHPFLNVQLDLYWSSTTRESDSTKAWTVNMSDGHAPIAPKTNVYNEWPVRGGNGYATGNW